MKTTVTDTRGTQTHDNSGKQISSNSSSPSNTGKGYAYTDKHGFSHVVSDYNTAKQYAAGGNVYAYDGAFSGGYARDANGRRMAVNTPGVIPYGNDVRDGRTTNFSQIGLGSLLPSATGLSTNTPFGGSYFGMSPEQYAAEIRRKESLGLAFTNPLAAATFKAANPGLFGAVPSAPVPTAPSYTDLPIPRAMEYPEFRPEPYRSTGPDIRIADEQTSVPTLAALGQWHDQQRDAYDAQLGQYNEEQRVLENYLAQQREDEASKRETEAARAELQREIEEQRQAEAVERWKILGVADQTVADVLGIPVGTPTNDAAYRQSTLALNQQKAASAGSRGGGGGGGGGGLTANQQRTVSAGQTANALAPYLMQYKSYNDLLADLPRIAPYIPPEAYTQLQEAAATIKDVYFDQFGDPVTPRDFTPGQGSPLMRGVQSLGGGTPSGGQNGGSSDPTAQKIQQAKANGYSAAEIKQALQNEGINPAKYGY